MTRTKPIALSLFLIAAAASSLAAQKHNPYLLTHDEIATRPNVMTAYEAVQQLRPRFFVGTKTVADFGSSRSVMGTGGSTTDDPSGGSSRSDGILVVIDGVQRGGVIELKQVSAAEVESIKFLKSHEASALYGNEQTGVIDVRTQHSAPKP
jgi:hypothetical protein